MTNTEREKTCFSMGQRPQKVIDRIMHYPHKEGGCSYICGPHLDPCVMVRLHDGDCACRNCDAVEAFRAAIKARKAGPYGEADMLQLGKDVVQPNETHTDCRSEEGVTVGLIDAIITVCNLLAQRNLTGVPVQEALKDLHADQCVNYVLRGEE